MGSSGLGFSQMSTDCLDVIIILGKQSPKILKDFHLLQHIPVNQKLLSKSQCQGDGRLLLLFPLNPYRTLLRGVMAGVEGIYLHPTLVATPVSPFRRDYNQVHQMGIPKVSMKVPAVLEEALAQRVWASQFAHPLARHGVGHRGSIFQQLLECHLRLADDMDIFKVASKRAGQHDFPTLATRN